MSQIDSILLSLDATCVILIYIGSKFLAKEEIGSVYRRRSSVLSQSTLGHGPTRDSQMFRRASIESFMNMFGMKESFNNEENALGSVDRLMSLRKSGKIAIKPKELMELKALDECLEAEEENN